MSRAPIYEWGDVPTAVQDRWMNAVARSTFRLAAGAFTFKMAYTEDPAPTGQVDLFDVKFNRNDLSTESVTPYITLRPVQDDARFVDEVVHTLGHVFMDGYYALHDPDGTGARARIAGWFTRLGQRGTGVDYYSGAWVDQIGEAAAEFFKDVYLSPRKNNNRTSWEFDQAQYNDFLELINLKLCPPQAG